MSLVLKAFLGFFGFSWFGATMRVDDCGQLPTAASTCGSVSGAPTAPLLVTATASTTTTTALPAAVAAAAAAAAAAAECLSAARKKFFPTSSYTVVGEVKKLVLCVGSVFSAQALPRSCAAVEFEAGYVAAFLKAARQGFASALVVYPASADPASASDSAVAEQTASGFVNRINALLGRTPPNESGKACANDVDLLLEFAGVADPLAWLVDSYPEVCAGAIVHAQFFGSVDVEALAAAVQTVMTGSTDTNSGTGSTAATKTSLRCPMVSLSAFVNSSDATPPPKDIDAKNCILNMLRGLDLRDPGFNAQQYALGMSAAPAKSFGATVCDANASEKYNLDTASAHGDPDSGAGGFDIAHAGLFLVRRTVSKALRAHATRAGATNKKYPDTQSRRQFAYMKR